MRHFRLIQKVKENYTLRKALHHLWNDKFLIKSHFIDGYKIYFNLGRNLGFLNKKKIIIEKNISLKFLELISEDFLIFDIGANIGYYTILFSSITKKGSGRVIAVEPDIYNQKILEKNIELNKLPNVTLLKKALSNQVGSKIFYQDESTGQTSSLLKNIWHPNSTKLVQTRVDSITLDMVTELYGVPDLIKCDVEGAEVLVLEGGINTLKKKPIILMEVKSKNKEIVYKILNENNYYFTNADISTNSTTIEKGNSDYSNYLCFPIK